MRQPVKKHPYCTISICCDNFLNFVTCYELCTCTYLAMLDARLPPSRFVSEYWFSFAFRKVLDFSMTGAYWLDWWLHLLSDSYHRLSTSNNRTKHLLFEIGLGSRRSFYSIIEELYNDSHIFTAFQLHNARIHHAVKTSRSSQVDHSPDDGFVPRL
jgi:hypothetical protein